MAHVFISHSTRDDAVVAALRRELARFGVDAWTDSQRLAGGDKLVPEIEAAIEEAQAVVAVLSPAAVNSAWMRREIRHALGVEKGRGDGYKVIPLLLPGIEPSALGLWFEDEPLGVKVEVGPGGIQEALPDLRAALGLQAPVEPDLATEPAEAAEPEPLADLLLELKDPAMKEAGGTRRARATATLTYIPADGSPRVESRRFPFTAPAIDTRELAWYLEHYPHWPSGVFQERAREVEKALPEWGRRLHAALLGEAAREPFEDWRRSPAEAGRRFTVEVDASLVEEVSAAGAGEGGESGEAGREARQKEAAEAATELLALPWELLADGKGHLFQGARPVRVRRRLPNRERRPPLLTEPPLRVLLISPRPEDEAAAYIDHRASALPLVEALAPLGDLARLTLLSPPTVGALGEELRRAAEAGEPYHAVHFDGHGVYDRKLGLGALCFERPEDAGKLEERRSHIVDAEKLASLIRDHRVPLFFLEACQSAAARERPTASVAGKLLEGGVASVAAMSHSVLVETARRFVAAFYRELAAGGRIGAAVLAGQRHLHGDPYRGKAFAGELHLQDWFVPVLFQEEDDPRLVQRVPGERVRAVLEERRRLALGELPKPPEHGFVGRSREMLEVERLLLGDGADGKKPARHAVLQGQGGEGKTALAVETARWLVASGRFERCAFVSLERHGDARAVLYRLGEQLVPEFVRRAGTDPKEGRKLLERALAEERVLLLLDNVESVLPPPALGGEAPTATGDEAEVLGEILDLCQALSRVGDSRLLFTSREALPEPFARHHVPIGRLSRREALELVANVLGEGRLMPHAADPGESDQEIEGLVEAVGCHARSLVLLAREVADVGVRGATRRLGELMEKLEADHPDDRERSLLASVELSLRRLPEGLRERLGPLGVVQGGVAFSTLVELLGLDHQKGEHLELARQLVGVGLGEVLPPGYLRLDPALGPALLRRMSQEEQEAARAAWAQSEAGLAGFLYQQRSKEPQMAAALTLLDLPNLLAVLEHLAGGAPPERVVDVATDMELLLSNLGRPRALARVVKVRERAAGALPEWSYERYLAEAAAVDRLLDAGRHGEAVAAARSLLQRAQAAGEEAYPGASYDLAVCHLRLGRTLKESGNAQAALEPLAEAQRRFEELAEAGDQDAAHMASVCFAERGDCFTALGRLEEAAFTCEAKIERANGLNDPRQVATGKAQLGRVRMLQRRYGEALEAYQEARKIFQGMGEARSVAIAWHQMGIVHRRARNHEEAEKACKESLRIGVETGDRAGQADTLNELGLLYQALGRLEEAVRFYREAAEVYVEMGDLAKEGRVRNNLADTLVKLGRHDEARKEIHQAIECGKPFGHAAEPWKTFNILHNLEKAAGNPEAAEEARRQAMAAYLAYRRDGGEPQVGGMGPQLCTLVAQAMATGATTEAAAQLKQLRQRADLPPDLQPLLPALEAILAGPRDPALAQDSALDLDYAAELLLLLEHLAAQSPQEP